MKRIYWLLAAGLIMFCISGCSLGQSQLNLKGVVETSIYSHFSEAAGKIIESPVQLGQEVQAGDVLAVMDDRDQQYALEQLLASQAKKQAVLAEIKKGSDAAEIQQGRNNVAIAEEAYASALLMLARAEDAYGRAESLYAGGGISQTGRDEAKYQLDMAQIDVNVKQSQLDNSRQKLLLLSAGANEEKIIAAQADIDLTDSQIRQAQENLAKFRITANSAGTVISKNYRLGDVVAPGANLADIASGEEKHLVAYLPEEYLSQISYGQEVVIKRGAEQFQGTINYIDAKAQYTPKEMQTAANKNRDSVKIEVLISQEVPLKVGENAELLLMTRP